MGPSDPMTLLASLEREAVMESWDDIQNFVAHEGQRLLQAGPALYKLRLATEELVSNVMRYAPQRSSDTQATVHLWLTLFLGTLQGQSALVLQLEDNGPAFDPQLDQKREVDTSQPIHERPIGGLGLFLVQQSVDHVDYTWLHQRNRYRLFVRLPERTGAATP